MRTNHKVKNFVKNTWAITGTGFVALLIGIMIGSITFLYTAGTKPPAPQQERDNLTNTKTALKAVDESRNLFKLINNGLISATSGIETSAKSVPQMFDSVDTAQAGAQQLVTGLDETANLTSALNQVAQVTTTVGNALSQTKGLQQAATAANGALVIIKTQLQNIEPKTPLVAQTINNIDNAINNSGAINALNQIGSLESTLSGLTGSIQNANGQVNTALTSAKSSARQLRDGLATLASARKSVTDAITNLTNGVTQLKIALGAIDQQLELSQNNLHKVTETKTIPEDPGTSRPLSWALIFGSIGTLIAYLLVNLATYEARKHHYLTKNHIPTSKINKESPLSGITYQHYHAQKAIDTDPKLFLKPKQLTIDDNDNEQLTLFD